MYLLPALSFRRRPESSGLLHTFPPGGNDHAWFIPASVVGAIRLTPRPAFLGSAEFAERPVSMQAYIPVEVDSGLRRNDDSG